MSFNSDTTFLIYHGGKFETQVDGTLFYVGGSMCEVVSPATALYQNIPVSLYSQRLWYKMPYEDLSELKVLCHGVDNFAKMCEASKWCKTVEIYMEIDEEFAMATGGTTEDRDGNEGGENSEHEGREQREAEIRDDEREEERSNEEREEREERRKTRRAEDEMCDEQDRVEEIVAGFVDEEENDDYRRTPHTSDCEGEANERINYDSWVRRSGNLEIRQVFVSVAEFRDDVLEYALKGGWNIQFTRWGAKKSEARCGIKKCNWRVYCSYEEAISQWMIKSFQEDHSCHKDGRCKILSESVICSMFINELRNDPLLKPIVMQERIHDKYEVAPSFDQCRKAKKRALELIEEEFNEQYRRMKDYRDELLGTNPGSTVELLTTMGDNGKEVFDSFYMCFAGLRNTWRDHCRPIFGIDGCFLKSNEKGQLLAAVGRDANNQIYSFAWAVVQVENTESWIWFIKHLKKDLELQNGDGFTLISDRQKGLLKAVDQELPQIEHRMCARHIYGNLKNACQKRPRMKGLFWEVVESFNVPDYEASLAKMKDYDFAVFDAFMSRNPTNCSRAFFKTTSTCEDALNNFSESYNSAINRARAMPLIQCLETMRRQAMVRIGLRRIKTQRHKSKHSLKVYTMIAAEEKEVKYLRSIPGRPGVFEVKEGNPSYKVNMKERTCKCRRWDLTGIPCRHVLRVVFDNKNTYKIEDLVSDWYLTSTWRSQYIESVEPVNGMKFWKKSEETRIEAPEREVHKGRKRKPEKRMKGIHESPTKGKKVTKHGRTMHCTRCSMAGHYASKCSNMGVPGKPRPPKKQKKSKPSNTEPEAMTLDDGPVPTQPTQT